jgi:protein phosphatase
VSLTVRVAARSDAGRVRDNNEDSYHAGTRVFCVADGLGGHLAGEVASGLAARTVASLDAVPVDEAVAHLAEEVRRANRLVHDEARSDPAKDGMGTTMTAVVIDDAAAHLAHVGDSRCYLLRDNDVQLLTEDHTVVGRMVADGTITEEQASEHPQRSMLTRALGTRRVVDVDVTHVPLRGGDRLLLCSDGLTAVVEPLELPRLTMGDDLETIVEQLVATSLERGAPDNVTVVLVEVQGTPSGMGRIASSTGRKPRRRPHTSPRWFGVPRRAVLWVASVALVLAAASIAVRSYIDGSYYVGVNDGRVAIFHGIPADLPVFSKQDLYETTDIEIGRVAEFQRKELEQGIVVGSLLEAQEVVEERVRPNLAPAPTPTPTRTRRPARGG